MDNKELNARHNAIIDEFSPNGGGMDLYEKKEHEDGSVTFEKLAVMIPEHLRNLAADYDYLRQTHTPDEAMQLLAMTRQRG